MAEKEILITSYTNPDLDGVACAIAYAELLTKQGHPAIAGVFGTLHREAQFVFKTFHITPPENAESIIAAQTKVILVDASDTTGISEKIQSEQVIEIIDHRKVNRSDKFPNAKVQIELVGAAATLIGEKFIETKIAISPESAALLYSAIVSNTINFQANVTTNRDKRTSDWLKTFITLPDDYTHEMFAYKSRITGPLKEVFLQDFAKFTFGGKRISVIQLEIIEVDTFMDTHREEIKNALAEIKKENNLDMIFLTCIDIERGYNRFVAVDDASKELVEKTMGVTFANDIAQRNGIIMRKEITPLLKEYLPD